MRKTLIAAASIAAAAGLLVPAVANADTPADSKGTTVTLKVNATSGGSLRFSVPPQGTMGLVLGIDGTSASSLATAPSVRDDRNGTRNFQVNAAITDFTTSGGARITNDHVKYYIESVASWINLDSVLTTASSSAPVTLDSEKEVLKRTGVTWGDVSQTFTPKITVSIPTGGDKGGVAATPGDYTATLTHSVY